MEWHKPPFLLKELKIEVTHDCNLHCLHCSSMATTSSMRSISREKVLNIINEAAQMGVTHLTFSGGEPLLYPHIEESVALAKSHGMTIFMYTTGNADNAIEKIHRIRDLGLNRAMFSIFGDDRKSHELVTKLEGSFLHSIDVIRKCAEINLPVEFHFVPLATNYRMLINIAHLSRSLGVERVSVLRLVPQGRAESQARALLSFEQNRELRQIIINLRSDGFEIRTGSPYNFLMLKARPACCAGIDRLTISPTLRISPCDAFKQIPPEKLGVESTYSSLENHSLSECWEKSPYLSRVRGYLTTPFANKCQGCDSLEQCLSGCMAQKFYKHGNLAKSPDPMCLHNFG